MSGRKEKIMNTVSFVDNQEFEIKEEASTGAVTVVVADFAELGTVADALIKPGNLNIVYFKTDKVITGEYTGMKLESPLFKAVDIVGGKVHATFGIREKTETEKRLDALEETTDYLVMDSLV